MSFQNIVTNIRKAELKYIGRNAVFLSIMNVNFSLTIYLIIIATFVTFIYSDSSNILDPNTAYVCLSLFNTVRVPLFLMGLSISELIQVSNFLVFLVKVFGVTIRDTMK